MARRLLLGHRSSTALTTSFPHHPHPHPPPPTQVIAAMIQIANADTLDDPTRTLAVEFMVTLCEARDRAPGMVRGRGP
jgi:hypothetical protein